MMEISDDVLIAVAATCSNEELRLAAEQRLRGRYLELLARLVEVSPYPDYEDADASCYWCGGRHGHEKDCAYAEAERLVGQK